MIKKLATLAAAVTMAVTLGACSGLDYYDNAYSGPAYVIGHYTCTDQYLGQAGYCVEYSDGTSSLVPFSIYDTVAYGDVLTYSGSVWRVHVTSYTRRGYAPVVYHVHYRAAHVSRTYSYSSHYGYSQRASYRAHQSSQHSSYRSSYHSGVHSRF